MTPKQQLVKQLLDDESISRYLISVDYPNYLVQIEIEYVDARGVRNVYSPSVLPCEYVYEDFLRCKKEQHWRDYREHLLIKTEVTTGTDWTPTIDYKVGDKFILDGMICEVIKPIVERDFFITEINYGLDYHQSIRCPNKDRIWKVEIKKELLRVRGTIAETYFLVKEDIPSLGNYSSNEDYYDALMKKINK